MSREKGIYNRYYLMRHGESEANVAGIINSDPAELYQLTRGGMEQACQVTDSKLLAPLGSRALFYCSPSPRAKQTALIASEAQGADIPTVHEWLSERGFGDFECCSDENYEQVWQLDAELDGPEAAAARREMRQRGVESPRRVAARMCHMVDGAETSHRQEGGRDVVFVSHGDTLNIADAVFSHNLQPHQHRQIEGFSKAEVRRLAL